MSKNEASRVHGIGGVFFRSNNPEATRNWYSRHLGLTVDAYGTNFAWRRTRAPEKKGYTLWSPFKKDTDYFGFEGQQFMINYRVDNLEALVAELKRSGVQIVDEIDQEPCGKFVHIVDNDGRRVELWEPIDDEYEKMLEAVTD